MATLGDMAAQLASVLRVQGNKGKSQWNQLHGKLAEVAAAVAGQDPTKAVQALVKVARDASSPPALIRALEETISKEHLKNLIYLVARELNMTPLGDSEPVHMVDKHSNFREEIVDRIVTSSLELSHVDASYAAVSIVGAQSSGKSYLLNHLFGTRFPVMDAKHGWHQTTRGIMISRCIWPSLLLLDVEGYDGMENEKDTSFERKSALFALTVSDLMIVNMNIADTNRGQASGSVLFRIIFEERKKIKGAGITKILVVVRDYNVETPVGILRNSIMKRLQQIWESANGQSIKCEDYIEVDIFGMPHKDSADFPKEVLKLRRLLSKNTSAKIPASSFSTSCRVYWEAIKDNKKLDIPSYQELIAKSYCQGIAKNTLKALDSEEAYKLLKAEESPSCFEKIAKDLLGSIITKYDLETKMYDPKVRDEERQCLVEELSKIFTDDSRELIWRVHENTLEQYKGLFDRNVQNMEPSDADSYGERIVTECENRFISLLEDHNLFDSTYSRRIRGEVRKKMESYIGNRVLEIKEKRARKDYEDFKAGLIKGTLMATKVVAIGATSSNGCIIS